MYNRLAFCADTSKTPEERQLSVGTEKKFNTSEFLIRQTKQCFCGMLFKVRLFDLKTETALFFVSSWTCVTDPQTLYDSTRT